MELSLVAFAIASIFGLIVGLALGAFIGGRLADGKIERKD